MILFFTDIHINETATFSTATETGFSVRQMESIQCFQEVVDTLKDPQYKFAAVVFGGDLFHKVGNSISTSDLACATKCILMVQEECIKQGITFYMIPGNHDIASNIQGFHKLITFKTYKNVEVVDTFKEIGDYVFMPYAYDDDEANSFLENIKDKQNKIVFSHLELKDVPLGNGLTSSHGASIKTLTQFKSVLQGHYHIPQTPADNIIVAGSCHKTSFKDPGGGSMIIYDDENNTYARKYFTVPSWYTFDDDNIDEVKELDSNNYVKVVISSENILKINNITREYLKRFKGAEIMIDVQKISLKRKQNQQENIENESEEEILHRFIEESKVPAEDKQELIEIGLDLIARARK